MLYPKAYKLLYNIIKKFKKNFRRSPNRTELIKLLYLTDLEYFKNYGEKYSELNYIFYHHGPWTRQYHELLNYMIDSEISEYNKLPDSMAWQYALRSFKPRHDVELDYEINTVLENNIFIYKESDLSQILQVVYTTEPLVSTPRNEEIDFYKVSLNIKNKRLQYKDKRKRYLDELEKFTDNLGDGQHDTELYMAFKPFRDRANELI